MDGSQPEAGGREQGMCGMITGKNPRQTEEH